MAYTHWANSQMRANTQMREGALRGARRLVPQLIYQSSTVSLLLHTYNGPGPTLFSR
jgi:hypothetical protein